MTPKRFTGAALALLALVLALTLWPQRVAKARMYPPIKLVDVRDLSVTGGAPILTSSLNLSTLFAGRETVALRITVQIMPGETSSTFSATEDTRPVPLLSGATLTAAEGKFTLVYGESTDLDDLNYEFGTSTRVRLLVEALVDGVS